MSNCAFALVAVRFSCYVTPAHLVQDLTFDVCIGLETITCWGNVSSAHSYLSWFPFALVSLEIPYFLLLL